MPELCIPASSLPTFGFAGWETIPVGSFGGSDTEAAGEAVAAEGDSPAVLEWQRLYDLACAGSVEPVADVSVEPLVLSGESDEGGEGEKSTSYPASTATICKY